MLTKAERTLKERVEQARRAAAITKSVAEGAQKAARQAERRMYTAFSKNDAAQDKLEYLQYRLKCLRQK